MKGWRSLIERITHQVGAIRHLAIDASRATLASLCLLTLCLVTADRALAQGGPADNPAESTERARKVLDSRRYQTEWPMTEGACAEAGERSGRLCREGQPREARKPREATPRRRQSAGGTSSAAGVSTALGVVSRALLWMVVAVVIIVLLVFLGNGIVRWRERRDPGAPLPGGDTVAPGEKPRPRLVEVERLAGQGHYGEAVHRLLLIAVDRLTRHRGESLEDSLTSREILRRLRLGEEGRGALERLVAGTERFLFAEVAVDREEFEACRRAFETLEGHTA
jgi:hypothetical protein